jgi:hypothetical protein
MPNPMKTSETTGPTDAAAKTPGHLRHQKRGPDGGQPIFAPKAQHHAQRQKRQQDPRVDQHDRRAFDELAIGIRARVERMCMDGPR